ncbi:MAG: AMP-binding protein [Spirochaetales bacterium]
MVTVQDIGEYTFPALFKNSVTRFANRPALSFANTNPITYAEVAERTEKIATMLYALGVRKGDKVAIWSGSTPNWGAAYFAIVNYGATALPILPDFTPGEVESIIKHADISGMIVSDKLFEKIQSVDDKTLPFIINIEDFKILRAKGVKNPDDISIPKNIPEVIVKEDDTASIIYTSGTTGRSKGVELTHKNLVFMAIQCQSVRRINKRDKCLSFLPLSHVYEFSIGFVMIFLNGACIYYLGKPPTVSSLLPAFKKVKPTIILSVPMVMEKIYKNKIVPTFTKTGFIKKFYGIRFFQKILHRIAGTSLKKTFGGRLTFFGIGGAKVDPKVEQFMKDARFPYAIGYGLTETSPLLAGSNPGNTKVDTIGPILKGIEVDILNPDAHTGIGEVIARGDNVMKGYYKEPELTSQVFTDEQDSCGAGWFKTGDLGTIHKGRLSLKGRLKNMILRSGGENIYPEDIEFVLNQHPVVTESLVIEDDDNGLVALVQLDEEKMAQQGIMNTVEDIKENILYKQEEILSEIKYFVNNQVNRFSKLGAIKIVSEFEKTASQKIKRYLYNLGDNIQKK